MRGLRTRDEDLAEARLARRRRIPLSPPPFARPNCERASGDKPASSHRRIAKGVRRRRAAADPRGLSPMSIHIDGRPYNDRVILTRRSFLAVAAGAAGASAAVHVPSPAAALPYPKGGRLGLELYSLRNQLKKDIAVILKKVRDWGFEDVELAGFPSMSATDTARVLRTAGLHAVSQFVDYERLRDDFGRSGPRRAYAWPRERSSAAGSRTTGHLDPSAIPTARSQVSMPGGRRLHGEKAATWLSHSRLRVRRES